MKNRHGFTIVELLIVIVVIALLATIVGVTYTGITERARKASLEADLTNAAKQMEVAFTREGKGTAFPTSMPSQVTTSQGNVLQLANTPDPKSFCINAYSADGAIRVSLNSDTGKVRSYLCSGYAIGAPVGGSVPPAPQNTNLAADFSTWSSASGIAYDSASGELRLDGNTSGTSYSPLIRIDGASRAKLSVDSYATKPSPTSTPETQVYFGSSYFDANGNPVQNTSGYTGNGNAQTLPLNQWKSFSWTIPAGPNVVYIRFNINSSPSNRTSDNRFRNVSIEAL